MDASQDIGPIARQTSLWRMRGLSLFGKSLMLALAELAANIACWTICAILFRKRGSIVGLALLSWVSELLAWMT
jgi:hypothetical protein